ncbi:hypothetical protein [Xaviernesmea oryzae]|nr:hypothetical protein [Xaviernesmea oryzae]SEM31634.1 hypothetical protein SAMN04487976_12824 [Xaviernesmea oryzae]
MLQQTGPHAAAAGAASRLGCFCERIEAGGGEPAVEQPTKTPLEGHLP